MYRLIETGNIGKKKVLNIWFVIGLVVNIIPRYKRLLHLEKKVSKVNQTKTSNQVLIKQRNYS